nr:ATP-binding protein [Acinetobacter sp. Marseille-Q1620]
MSPSVFSSTLQTIYRLGTWYTVYRLIIAFSLIAIFFINYLQNQNIYPQSSFYFYILVIYAAIGIIQMLLFRYVPHIISKQLIALFFIDVTYLSLLTYANTGPDLSIGLLFVITVLAANFLLKKNQALLVTLTAIISIIYQHFVSSLIEDHQLNHIGNSIFLAFLFFVVYALGQYSRKRFQFLESLSSTQSIKLSTLQNINRYILEQTETGYLVLDETLQVIVCNPAAHTLLELENNKFNQYQSFEALHPQLFELFQHVTLLKQSSFQFKSENSLFHINIQIQKLVLPEQELSMLILHDSQKLNQQVQQLKLAALGQLSASIAHEIRNPLAMIVQANELILESDEQEKNHMHRIIATQSERIDKIITETLNMAKNKAIFPIKINLKNFFQELKKNDFSAYQDKIQLNIKTDLEIYFDETQFLQVIHNLIRNALRHNSNPNQPIQILAYSEDKNIYIDVIDFGKGVSKLELSQLFKPFFSTEIDGTGLGLYLSKSLCEANQAKLSYVEQDNIGACFRIECSRTI